MNDWVLFIDPISLFTVLIPTISAWFINRDDTMPHHRAVMSLTVSWVSSTLMMLYGFLMILSSFDNYNLTPNNDAFTLDYEGLAASLHIVLLPMFYAVVISLLMAPYAFQRKSS